MEGYLTWKENDTGHENDSDIYFRLPNSKTLPSSISKPHKMTDDVAISMAHEINNKQV